MKLHISQWIARGIVYLLASLALPPILYLVIDGGDTTAVKASTDTMSTDIVLFCWSIFALLCWGQFRNVLRLKWLNGVLKTVTEKTFSHEFVLDADTTASVRKVPGGYEVEVDQKTTHEVRGYMITPTGISAYRLTDELAVVHANEPNDVHKFWFVKEPYSANYNKEMRRMIFALQPHLPEEECPAP